MFGWNGKFADIDLTSHKIKIIKKDNDYYQRYIGGRGFIIETLLNRTRENVDPLSAENTLVFALGPLTGVPVPGSGRNSVGAKSPITGAFGESEVGGYWGAELKRAGFDTLIFHGISATPVYLWVKNGKLELRDAKHLWNREVAETQQRIRSELGDRNIRTATIGIAGENLVSYACIINDLAHAAGRCGLGAVMGSKRLKCIAVRGSQTPDLADKTAVKDISMWMVQNYKKVTPFWDLGTCRMTSIFNGAGNLPTRNFSLGEFENIANISGDAFHAAYGKGMRGCYSCPVKCKTVMQGDRKWEFEADYGGPEYETVASFGSDCMVDDPGAICKAHDLCNRHGLDTISAGACIAFAMECYENGIISAKDTDGIDLRFGNAAAMIQMLEDIIGQQGFGKILAKGSKKAAEIIGNGAEQLAMHVKGLEIPMHEPRLKQGLGLHMAVNAAGADHVSGIHDTLFIGQGGPLDSWNTMDYAEPINLGDIGNENVRLQYQLGWTRSVINLLGLCAFVAYTPDQMVDLVRGVTGIPFSIYRLHKTNERIMTLCRIYNLREGLTRNDDVLPGRFHTALKEGANKGVTVGKSTFETSKTLYYQMMGWGDDGVPTKSKLAELDIQWAEKYLPDSIGGR